MRVILRAFIAGAVLLTTSAANADENVCKDSYEQSQVLMKSQLLPAREMLRSCMRSGCKDWMVSDCSKWLGEVEQRIPTVVFYAKNTAGRDLTDVKVTKEDGSEIAARIDGRAIELEPGEQTFVFVSSDGTKREKKALVREGEKAQKIEAQFDAPPEELAKNGGGPLTNAPPPVTTEQTSPLKMAGFAATGVGVIGLGVGGVFGLIAMSKKSSANCDPSGACDAGPLDDARSAATVATVGLIAGGVLAAAGITLLVVAPSSKTRVETTASITPTGVFLNGRF